MIGENKSTMVVSRQLIWDRVNLLKLQPSKPQTPRSQSIEQLVIDDIRVEITRKKIKNLHLRVHPPLGHVRVSAPQKMSLTVVRRFVQSRVAWIRDHQQRMLQRPAPVQLDWCDAEQHPFLGADYPLRLIDNSRQPQVSLTAGELVIQSRSGSNSEQRAKQLDQWYRIQLLALLEPMSQQWQVRMGVVVSIIKVRKMKTRWGSCTTGSGAIRINLELVKKPVECIEYVLVHELVHLLERGHNQRFYRLMDQFLPDWQARRGLLLAS